MAEMYFSNISQTHMLFFVLTAAKSGSPGEEELEELAEYITDVYEKLGRRLEIHDAKLYALRKDYEKCSEIAYQMLLHWKQRDASNATYQVLYDALCHSLVNRRDLAQKFCCNL